MKLIFSPLAMEQWNEWKHTNPNVANRIKRIVYKVVDDKVEVEILSMKYHYKK